MIDQTLPVFCAIDGRGSAGPDEALPDLLLYVQSGRAFALVDDVRPDGRTELVVAAGLVTRSTMHFFIRHTSGFVTVALPQDRCDRLQLPPVVATSTESHSSTYAVAVDATAGTTTGISAHDRARTARSLADPWAVSSDFTRPGHLVPVRVPTDLESHCGTDPAFVGLEVCSRAGFPAAVMAALVADTGELRNADAAQLFAERHDLPCVRISDMVRSHRRE
jgi:3,4-dihydroxy 2-butanone 4-phosphate synthase/GTP cyclohydrolase II